MTESIRLRLADPATLPPRRGIPLGVVVAWVAGGRHSKNVEIDDEDWLSAEEAIFQALADDVIGASGNRRTGFIPEPVPAAVWVHATSNPEYGGAPRPVVHYLDAYAGELGGLVIAGEQVWRGVTIQAGDVARLWPKVRRRTLGTVAAETRCRAWLEARMQESPSRPKPLDTLYSEARGKFGEGLSRRAFDRAVKEAGQAVPSARWHVAGAPKKSPHQQSAHQ